MTKKTKLIFALSIIIVVIASAITAFTVFSNQKNNKVIAKVNGEKIYQSELEDKLAKMFQNQMQNQEQKISINNFPPQVIEALVQDIYLQKELDKVAAKSAVAKNEDLKKQIDDYKKTVIRQAYLDSLTVGKIDDAAVKNKYSEISNQYAGKKEMHLRHILVASEEEAKKVTELLSKKNSSFEKLAKEYSKDESNAPAGGDLGYVIPDNLDEDFAKAVVELKKGQISNPIKTKFGWHIVKMEDSRNLEMPAFEAVKTKIEASLKQEIIDKVFSNITKDAKVRILIDLKQPKKTTDEKSSEASPTASKEINTSSEVPAANPEIKTQDETKK